MSNIDFCIEGYEGLYWDEYWLLLDFDESNDLTLFGDLIRNETLLSNAMRQYLADRIEGKIKRARGKRGSTLSRDFEIHKFVKDSMSKDPKLKLTSGKFANGAAYLAGEQFKMSEDAIIKAYQKIEKAYQEDRKINNEEDECSESIFIYIEKLFRNDPQLKLVSSESNKGADKIAEEYFSYEYSIDYIVQSYKSQKEKHKHYREIETANKFATI